MKFGEKSQQEFSNKLYTGFAMCEVLLCNPSTAERGELFGYTPKEDSKDQVYEGKDSSGNEYVDLVFYLRAITHEDKPIFPVRFRFVDKDVEFEKDENGVKTVKYQYCNNVGAVTSVDDPKNLLDKFKFAQVKGQNIEGGERTIRKCIQGEANFYNFMQAWLDNGVAFFGDASLATDIFLDKKKAFRNIEKYVKDEIRPLIGSEQVGKFNALAVVGISEKDGKVNHFQNVHNQFWPDWKFKSMSGAVSSGNWNTPELQKTQEYLIKGLKKSAYSLGWIKLFNENDHQQSGNETFKAGPESDSSDVDDTNY